MINNSPSDSRKTKYIGSLGNPNNTEVAKTISLALIALKIGDVK